MVPSGADVVCCSLARTSLGAHGGGWDALGSVDVAERKAPSADASGCWRTMELRRCGRARVSGHPARAGGVRIAGPHDLTGGAEASVAFGGAGSGRRRAERRGVRRRSLLPVDPRAGDPYGCRSGRWLPHAAAASDRFVPAHLWGRHPDRPLGVGARRRRGTRARGRRRPDGRLPARALGRRRRVRGRPRRRGAKVAGVGTDARRPRDGRARRQADHRSDRRARIARNREQAWHHARDVRSLYRARRLHTFGHPPTGEWVLVDGRHVERVGAGDPPSADRIVDLPGSTIVPGLIDAHIHLTSLGLSAQNEDVAATGSAAELLSIARDRAHGVSDELVALQGYDETRWADPTLPSLDDLDAASPAPLVIRRTDGHVALLNGAALSLADALDTPGVERDGDGRPTGVVTGTANRAVGHWAATARSAHQIEALQLAGAARAASQGVTTVHEMSLPLEFGALDLETLLAHRRDLPVSVEIVLGMMDVPKAVELGLGAVGGDLAADGSLGAR